MDLIRGFVSWDDSKKMFEDLKQALVGVDSSVGVLALEGLHRMEDDVKRGQLDMDNFDEWRDYLRKWRDDFHLTYKVVPNFLQKLIIFKELKVPITDVERSSPHGCENEDIPMDVETTICSDTHSDDGKRLTEDKPLRPNDSMDSIEGCCSRRDDESTTGKSVYGKQSFNKDEINFSWDRWRQTFQDLLQTLDEVDPSVAVLALEGFCRLENDLQEDPFIWDENAIEHFRDYLRKWRCDAKFCLTYKGIPKWDVSLPKILRTLTVFKTLEVPMFIDRYGSKVLLSFCEGDIEDIIIDGETPICHVTHIEEAQSIEKDQKLKPSDNKNSIEGCWFGVDDGSSTSVYGSRCFRTTLSRLNVKGLRQGEIVAYKHEVNVILYAEKGPQNFEGLKKPTRNFVTRKNPDAYIKVSIFILPDFLPDEDKFKQVIEGPFPIKHGPFCVKLKRNEIPTCSELE